MKHNTREQFVADMKRSGPAVIAVKKYIFKKYGIKSIITNEADSKREHIDIRVLKKEHQDIDETVYSEFMRKFGYKIEVKYDQASIKTGNIYLEIWSNVRINPPNPGTITQCRAHSIWYVLDKKFLVFDRAALLSCLLTHFYFNTEKAQIWRKTTNKPSWHVTIKEHLSKFNSYVDKFGEIDGQIKTMLMPSAINADVRGILVPIAEAENLKEKIGLVDVIPIPSSEPHTY